MKTLRGVLCSVALIANACGASHRAALDDGGQSVLESQGFAGVPSAASHETALRDADGGSAVAGGTALAGAGGASGALASGVTAGEPAAPSMVDVADVTRDCAETLQCVGASGPLLGTVADCVAGSLEALNKGSAEMQRRFKQVFEVCISFKACEYVACTER
jgi:hypothetical protein